MGVSLGHFWGSEGKLREEGDIRDISTEWYGGAGSNQVKMRYGRQEGHSGREAAQTSETRNSAGKELQVAECSCNVPAVWVWVEDGWEIEEKSNAFLQLF